MALKDMPPLKQKEWKFVVDQLAKEEKNPNPERLRRIKQAKATARKMKTFYH